MKKLSFVLCLGQLLIILLFLSRLPPELPLFYSRPWGKEQLTTPFGLFLLPAISLIIFFTNLVVLSLVPNEEKLITKLLETTSVIFNLLCLVTLIKIIILVA